MTSHGESRIPSVGVSKDKKRSLLPAPKSHSKLPTASSSAIPQPGHSASEPRTSSSREASCDSRASSEPRSLQDSHDISPRSSREGSYNSPINSRESSVCSPEVRFTVGDRVVIAGVKPGVLRYFGRTHFAEGEWCGIELDEAEGKNDGTVEQVRYFNCEYGYGIFAPKEKISLLSPESEKETGVKREASTERVSHLKHPKTSQLAQPFGRSSSPDVGKDSQLKFQSKLTKPRAIVKPLNSAAKEDEKENNHGTGYTESEVGTLTTNSPEECSKRWTDSIAMTTIPDVNEDSSMNNQDKELQKPDVNISSPASTVDGDTPQNGAETEKFGDVNASINHQRSETHIGEDGVEVTANGDDDGHKITMSDVRQTSTPVKEIESAEGIEPMDICETSERLSPVLPIVDDGKIPSPASIAATVEMEQVKDAPVDSDAVSAVTNAKPEGTSEMEVDAELKESETSVKESESRNIAERKSGEKMELEESQEKDDVRDDGEDSEMKDETTDDSVNITGDSIDLDQSSSKDKDVSLDDEADSSIIKDEGPGEKGLKDQKAVSAGKVDMTKKSKDNKENEKAKTPRGRTAERKPAGSSTDKKPKVMRRANSTSAATDLEKSHSGKSLKAVFKKDTPGKSEAKKAKVGSKIAGYIKSPTSDTAKDVKEIENNSKFSKNIVNKKKADIISNADKKMTVNMVRRSSAPVPRLDVKGNAPKSLRTDKEEENAAKTAVKRNPPKSKWSNIMTQINENTDKKTTTSRTNVTAQSKPAPKSRLATTTAGRTGGTSPRPAAATTNRPPSSRPSASKTSTTSQSDRPASRTSSVPARPRPSAKPTNKTTASLRDGRSPSADSHISSISQVSSQGSKASRNTTTTTRDSTPERMVQRMGKRQSMSAVETATSKHSRIEDRRASVAASSRLSSAGSKRDAPSSKTAGPAAAASKSANNQNRNRAVKPGTVKRGASSDKSDGPSKPPGPVVQQEITRLEALCEARTKELNYTKMQLKTRITSFEAMTTLVKYMSEELDAFACPRVTAELARVKHHLEQASSQLEELERGKNSLAKKVESMKAHNAAERTMLIMEHHKSTGALEERLKHEAASQVQAVIDKHSHEVTTLRNFHERNLSEMKNTYEKSITEKDKECDAKISELKKEHELFKTDLQKKHQTKLEEITARFENIKFTLLDKVDILRRECEEMRQREKTYIDQCQRDSDHKLHIALAPYRNLPAEIESLKTVIEMRNHEIHDLRRHNLDLETQRDELLAAKDKIKNLFQQKENLEAIVTMKAEYEKQLTEKHQVLMRRYDKESKANKRLSMDKEELTWRLSQSEYTMNSSFSGSPDMMRRTISHSPTSPCPSVNMSSSVPDGSSSILRRKKSPSTLIPSPRTSNSDNHRNSSGEYSPRTSTPTSTGEHSPTPKSPRDKESKCNLKRSGTYDLLDREDLEIDMKQSDV